MRPLDALLIFLSVHSDKTDRSAELVAEGRASSSYGYRARAGLGRVRTETWDGNWKFAIATGLLLVAAHQLNQKGM